MFRPRRPRSSSDALSASFNGELLDSQQHYNSYDHTDAAEDSDDGPICVPALISPPRSAGEDVDLSPPDIGMASLDFDPMSFQCSGPDSSFAFPADDSPAAEGLPTKRSPGSISSSNVLSAPPLSSRSEGEKTESRRLTSSFSYTEKPTQAVSPIKCSKAPSLTSFALSVPPSSETPDRGPAEPSTSSQLSALRDPPPVAGSLLLKGAEPSLSEAFQVELQAKLAAFESADGRDEDAPPPAASRQEQRGTSHPHSPRRPVSDTFLNVSVASLQNGFSGSHRTGTFAAPLWLSARTVTLCLLVAHLHIPSCFCVPDRSPTSRLCHGPPLLLSQPCSSSPS